MIKIITQARRFIKNSKGAVAIEFALLAPIAFIFILGIIEIGLIGYTSVALESIVTQAAREASIGTPASAGTTRADFATSIIRDKSSTLVGSEALRIDSRVISVTDNVPDPVDEVFDVCLDPFGVGLPTCDGPFEDMNGNGVYDGDATIEEFGTANEVVQINVTLPWRANFSVIRGIFGENGVTVLRASTIVKNEPF